MVRAGYRRLLEETADIRVIAEAASGEDAYRITRENDADVIVLDISMAGMGGLEAMRRMLARAHDAYPDIQHAYFGDVREKRIARRRRRLCHQNQRARHIDRSRARRASG
ncbi:MAG: response regulator [Burkholderiales bacterium]